MLHVVEHEVTTEFKGLRKLLPLVNIALLSFPLLSKSMGNMDLIVSGRESCD